MNGEKIVAKIQMEVISEPQSKTMAIIKKTTPQYYLRNPYLIINGEGMGKGDTDYVCGCCRVTLVSGANRGQIINIVLHCGNCGSYNIVRGT